MDTYIIRLDADQMQVLKYCINGTLYSFDNPEDGEMCDCPDAKTKEAVRNLADFIEAAKASPAELQTGDMVLVEAVFTRRMKGGDVAVTFTPLVAPIWEYEELAGLQVPANKVHPAN